MPRPQRKAKHALPVESNDLVSAQRSAASKKCVAGLAKLQAQSQESVPLDEHPTLTGLSGGAEQGMASRSRPRNGAVKDEVADAHEEEVSMWNELKRDIAKCSEIQKRQREVSKDIVDLEEGLRGKKATLEQIDKLSALYRENVKLAADEQRLLKEEPADILKNIGLLRALRDASAHDSQVLPPSKAARKPKLVKPDMLDGAADSPGPSPSVSGGPPSSATTRLKGSSARSGSVASTREVRETTIKTEDGGASGLGVGTAPAVSSESVKGPSAERAGKFFLGAEVAYKQAKMKADGSQWIQCNIIAVTEIKGQKQYKVQDPEPDENGDPGQMIYRASAAALIPIPPADAPLPDYPVGKHVLARYPETTTFYRAEVTGVKRGVCVLKFEDDQNQEMEVDRRFVLDVGAKP